MGVVYSECAVIPRKNLFRENLQMYLYIGFYNDFG